MKKILLTGLGACIITTVFISSTYAQQPRNAVVFTQHSPVTANSFTVDFNNRSFNAFPLSEIGIKAVKHFTKSFKHAENVHWYKVDDGVIAYFTENGIKSRTGYGKKGNWLYNIRSYREFCLPKDTRAQVKSAFHDFSITWVNEITTARQIIYLVHIEDESCFKTVRVCEGEIEITEEFVKR